jgi:formate dehydrogenase accessory protein FdhE
LAPRQSRALRLAEAHPAAAEPLRFYAGVATLQESLVRDHPAAVRHEASFVESLDLDSLSCAAPRFLSALMPSVPARLGADLRQMEGDDPSAWRAALDAYVAELAGGGAHESPSASGDARRFTLEALLQPFAAAVASWHAAPGAPAARCPLCGDLPMLALLREEAHGARRSLVCGLCSTEWPARRIECVACGETRFDALPAFQADAWPAARIDACESCRVYMKTLDLTKDATAIPVVDDIATLTLDVWARTEGYRRLRSNLLRL